MMLRVGIVGAGIGGLTLAASLAADGHHVAVYEQHVEPASVGAGLTLFGNAFTALDAVGLGERVRAVSSDAVARLRAGQRLPSGSWLMSLPSAMVPSVRSLHRGELHRVLLEALPAGRLHLSCRAEVAASGEPVITVDGERQRFDLVVAADGLRSSARAALGLDQGLRYAGFTAWRGVTTGPVAVHDAGETWGAGRIFGIVPLPDDHVYWFATDRTAAGERSPDEHAAVRARFARWHDPIPGCIEATRPETVLRHDIYDLAQVPTSFVVGRTVLLGDAAHGMTPNLGQGAGQAIEDAVTLALVLRQADLDTALHRYSVARRRRTVPIWRQSRMMGTIAHLSSPAGVGVRNAMLRATPASAAARAAQRVGRWAPPTPSP